MIYNILEYLGNNSPLDKKVLFKKIETVKCQVKWLWKEYYMPVGIGIVINYLMTYVYLEFKLRVCQNN